MITLKSRRTMLSKYRTLPKLISRASTKRTSVPEEKNIIVSGEKRLHWKLSNIQTFKNVNHPI